jgi:hypothetical protein
MIAKGEEAVGDHDKDDNNRHVVHPEGGQFPWIDRYYLGF